MSMMKYEDRILFALACVALGSSMSCSPAVMQPHDPLDYPNSQRSSREGQPPEVVFVNTEVVDGAPVETSPSAVPRNETTEPATAEDDEEAFAADSPLGEEPETAAATTRRT
jgi:hypothetical protein